MVDLIKKTWRGTRKADKVKFNNVDQGSLLAGDGNDIIEITAVEGGLINLGAGNDTLSIGSFSSIGAAQLVTTIDGGVGSDTLNFLNPSPNGFQSNFQQAQGWSISSNGQFMIVKNIETVIFPNNVQMRLRSDGTATVIGTDKSDVIGAFSDDVTRMTVNAGAGDDTITLDGIGSIFSNVISLIDGGDGKDTLQQKTNQETQRLVPSRSGWYLQKKEVNQWNFAARLVNIERIAFADGSFIELGAAGVSNTASSRAATLTGTSGDDTFTGSSGDDSIIGLGGNDIFDLTAGGADTIDLAEVYTAGLTEITIKGRKSDDNIFTPTGQSIISDNRSFNAAGVQVGDAVLQWRNSVILVAHFL